MKDRIIKFIYGRYMSWRLPELVAPNYPVMLDYPVNPTPRYGYGKPAHPILEEIIASRVDNYAETLRSFVENAEALSRIATNLTTDEAAPSFTNNFFSGLDAIALYTFLASRNPKTLFEIGSGNSTRFARRAINDKGLQTRIISCDPQPRADVETICDEVIRQPFETLNLATLDILGEGDILFIDSSHCCFTNSDVTVEFLEAIPRLRPGVLVHIHDILLPYDYPPSWSDRHYSEQYLLACYLLGGGKNMEIVLPNAYVSLDSRLASLLDPIWQQPGMATVLENTKALHHGYLGFSFWMQTKRSDSLNAAPKSI
jgi:hypothetical protein